MIAASRWIATVALGIAAALHLAGVMRLDLNQDVLIDGGQAGATEASLGDAFADLIEGTLEAVETEDVTEPVDAQETVEDVRPEDTTETVPPDETVSEADTTEETPSTQAETQVRQTPVETTPARPEPQPVVTTETTDDLTEQPDPQATIVAVPDAEPVPTPTLRATAPTVTTPETVDAVTATVTAAPQPETLAAVTPVAPTNPTPTEPQAQPDTLTADEPDQLDLTQSLRPKVRSRAFEERNKPDTPPPAPRRVTRAEPAPAAPLQRGNQAQTNQRAGQANGSADAPAAQRATGNQQSASVGNAAVSNYPGQVMKRIQRVRRPKVRTRGAATVAFRIASNGGLSAVSVARSSGSAELDRAAMQVIRQAAPFPTPPQGARRSFSIQIKGR
ncbi:MAG: TonB family protein [Pseudomonadota bacterium]